MLSWMDEELGKPATVKLAVAHREIYAAGDKGPRNVRYCLLCTVLKVYDSS